MFIKELKPKLWFKRRGRLHESLVILHDDARLYNSAYGVNTLHKLGFEVLKNAFYNPDLASSDFHLFGSWKQPYKDKHSPLMRKWK